nr:MAG TPA: nucelotide kinase [Caudoviricetes sp.]
MPNVPSHYSISHDNAPNGLLAILEELSDSENVPTPFASIALFNARKYLLRAPRKNGLEDLVKCRDYLERCIAIYESDLMLIRRQVVGGSVYLCYDYTADSNNQS